MLEHVGAKFLNSSFAKFSKFSAQTRCEIRGGALQRIRMHLSLVCKPQALPVLAICDFSLEFSCYKESAKKHNKVQSGGRFHPVEVVDDCPKEQNI